MFVEIKKSSLALNLAPKRTKVFGMKIGLCGIKKQVVLNVRVFKYEFCEVAHAFSIVASCNFFECNLSKNTQRHHQFIFCFHSRINMVGTQDALEFNMEEGEIF
jgi:hypothetical protein